jgi:nicotinate-nucleotide adenylyltransferase
MPEISFIVDGDDLKVLTAVSTKGKTITTGKGSFESVSELRGLASGEGRILCLELAKAWSFMAGGSQLFKLPKLFLKNAISEQAVFFGGCFNPWHAGHKACVDLCPQQNIIIVPDSNPWKSGVEHEKKCPWEQYLDLCFELKDTPYSIYPGFCGLEEANPTIDWFPKVQLEKKSLLVGDDNFLAFPKWQNFEELLQSIDTLYTTPRQADKLELEHMRDNLLEKNPKLKIQFLEHHDFEDVSSSQIRETREKGGS